MNIDSFIEKVVSYFTEPSFADEVISAKQEFFEKAGIIDEQSAEFETRMAQFLDWYLFTRPIKEVGKTPIILATEIEELKSGSEAQDILQKLAETKHSLFEFIKIKGEDVYLKDLIANKKLVLKKSPIVVGFTPEEIFDARLIPDGNSFVFSNGFCFHPAQARKYILKGIKKVRKLPIEEHEALMLKLIKMRYRLEQYKHVKVEHIYNDESKLKI